MKKLFAILAVLSLLMVPCVSMASTMTDSDLADVTGQMGVTIEISNMQIGMTLGTITWGDLDGFGATYTYAGYVNMVIPMISPVTPFVMHIGVPAVTMTIDVGSTTDFVSNLGTGIANKSAVAIGISATTVTVDAIAAYIFVNNEKGGDFDYVGDSGAGGYFTPFSTSTYQNSKVVGLVSVTSGGTFSNGSAGNSTLATDCLGVIGMSHISASVNALTVLISAH